MRKRRQINADPDKPTLRSTVAAATEPVRGAAFAVEEKVVWKGADRLRKLGEAARWPFERIAWAFERLLIWPLQDRTAGWAPSPGAGGVAAVLAIVAGVAVFGIALSADGGNGGERVVVDAAPAISPAPPAQPEAPSGTVLHGASPSFDVGSGVGVSSAPTADAGEEAVASVGSADATAGLGEEASAATSSTEPVPAGPAAMKVARRFAEAFVFYEIGKRPDRAASVFSATASPALSEALADRPPRLPSATEVPKAKVLNLVPGPRSGRAYTVSVSLLRVGVTSELRLELKKAGGSWTVTDVRG